MVRRLWLYACGRLWRAWSVRQDRAGRPLAAARARGRAEVFFRRLAGSDPGHGA